MISRWLSFRWFNLKDDRSTHRTRPLEWRDNGSNPYNVTLVLDIVQQLLDAEPVNHQHTWITVLANTPAVRLARLGDPDGSVTLRVQGTPYDHLARMVYNAPLHRTEQWLRYLVKEHWITLHWVILWVALSAIRLEYVATKKDTGFQTNIAATAIYYMLWGVLAIGSTAVEMWLFPEIAYGVERLAAMYHEAEFARLWDQKRSRGVTLLRQAAARQWNCSEADVIAQQLHIRTSFSVVRTIANMLREEKGRVEDALLALDMRLPLLQNLTSTSQAEQELKLIVHVEHEVRRGFWQRIHLSHSSFAATGSISWRQGVCLKRPGELDLARQAGENSSPSRAPASTEGSMRRDSRAAVYEDAGSSPTSHKADPQGVGSQGTSTGDNAV